jgi:hypothetical protein
MRTEEINKKQEKLLLHQLARKYTNHFNSEKSF